MEEICARLSRAGRIVCGRPGPDGRYTCDEPLADHVTRRDAADLPERCLVPLPGWALDKKGVWHKTTRVDDLRARGIAPCRIAPHPGSYPDLPALARCPKCRAVQWLEPARLKVSPHPNSTGRQQTKASRFL